jgi:cytochrome c-type biogenesis protein CcmH/NrfF
VEEIRKSIRNLVRLNKISALIYSFIVPVMVGVFAAYHHELNTVNPLLFWIPVVLLIGLALVFAWFTFDIKLAPE